MSEELTTSGTFKIRPAGRHILTIGRDLIQNPYAAIIELVKNAYDADATKVSVTIKKNENNKTVEILIEDDGIGMTRDVVVNRWMVPSTDCKQKSHTTSSGRTVQGRKGIGRYSASVLGNELLLETVSKDSQEKTSVYVDWSQFEKAEFLSDVDILIESQRSKEKCGTRINITGDSRFLECWEEKEFKNLRKELIKIKSPLPQTAELDFHVFLTIEGFSYKDGAFHEEIVPLPLFDLYDYRIHGLINADGCGQLQYEIQKVKNIPPEFININLDPEKATGCGSIELDIRVFDRDKDAIEDLIGRGLKDPDGNYVGKLDARKLLNDNVGIGVYRNGFRIRPLGDANFDWLQLNKIRVLNPSKKIGSDQVIGIVNVESEESSGLIEKSARDGLKENNAYERLVYLTRKVIGLLEERRFIFRYENGLGRKRLKIERDLEKLISFESLRSSVEKTFSRENISTKASMAVMAAIDEAEKEKNEVLQSIKELVAIYQGQATMGKIVGVVLHEGRKPLSFFRNQIPIFEKYYDAYKKGELSDLDEIYERLKNNKDNAITLINLFDRLDPLASTNRGKKKPIPLIKTIKDVVQIYESEMENVFFDLSTSENDEIYFDCWKQDIYTIISNLVENSLYWMNQKKKCEKKISIYINVENGIIEYIDYRDTGVGIDPKLIENEIIFEPNFSTKPNGTGLGLCLVGEAAQRCNWKLEAKPSDTGAYFRLRSK